MQSEASAASGRWTQL